MRKRVGVSIKILNNLGYPYACFHLNLTIYFPGIVICASGLFKLKQ